MAIEVSANSVDSMVSRFISENLYIIGLKFHPMHSYFMLGGFTLELLLSANPFTGSNIMVHFILFLGYSSDLSLLLT